MREEEIVDKNILLDTNVIRSLGDSGFRNRLQRKLNNLADKGNRLGISDITYFEIFRRNQSEEEDRFFTQLLRRQNLVVRPIDKDVLNKASILCRMMHPNPSNEKNNIMGDMLIGASAMDTDVLLLTGDRKDFKEPYWNLIGETYLTKKKKPEGREMIVLYYLKFDFCSIEERYMTQGLREYCLAGQHQLDF